MGDRVENIQVDETREGEWIRGGTAASYDAWEIMLGEATVEAFGDANSESLGVGMLVAWGDDRLWGVEHVLAGEFMMMAAMGSSAFISK